MVWSGAFTASNQFWSAGELRVCVPDFERVSRFLHFPDYQSYIRAKIGEYGGVNPMPGRIRSRAKSGYYRASALAGRSSDWIMPSLASTFRRKRLSRLMEAKVVPTRGSNDIASLPTRKQRHAS